MGGGVSRLQKWFLYLKITHTHTPMVYNPQQCIKWEWQFPPAMLALERLRWDQKFKVISHYK